MPKLTPDQRNYLYLTEAARVGIHKPILAALYQAQGRPNLADGETGLGVAPANRIPLSQVDSFSEQVQFAANTVRSITDRLSRDGWSPADIWDVTQGRYSDRFLSAVAAGYAPPAQDTSAARLEVCNAQTLIQAYLQDLDIDYRAESLPQNLAYLDKALLTLIERLPRYYASLGHQREAMVEGVRVWRQLDTRTTAIASLNAPLPPGATLATVDDSYLDKPLIEFMQRLSFNFSGLPHQREGLLRLTQLWRQLDSREAAIASLAKDTSGETGLRIVDPALIAFVQRVPSFYQGVGEQRHAITEGYRIWNKLDSRTTTLTTLGVNPALFSGGLDRDALATAAAQLDRALLEFLRRVPTTYQEDDQEREALIRLVQLWRKLPSREATIQSLFEDVRRMEQARRDAIEIPKPQPMTLPSRPSVWTPDNIQLYASIIPNGSFSWAEATHGGTRMPPDQYTVDAIVRIANLAQQARDRIGRPFHVTSWYRPPEINARVGGASESRHIVGDAIDFYCDGLTGDQIYWALDPWWPGGLGRYIQYPYLGHLDARSYRARWTN
ncbi:D-Ala-D-Ala carboxypeptidase family metallohydrolase [Geitlerinema sp. PCC 7407]|uniref:D-Ala-D-Ala carboxypeptidase family metallohydrolase n=1 Tax=Geitlerinema sp. PCC 7407 TaxID=1173025 RepID=UPI00029F93D3|nr:D-Ala-D-Ala carboxypeptidase family metallohydrolase [Geitlerinema sp. PCC 7407]AFY65105.1 Peptidase M15A [Geitlerinema sp. PCC 7407]